MVNERENSRIIVQPYEGHWSGARVVHRPYFQTPYGRTLVPCSDVEKESVRYEALVSQVELYTGGELTHGSARRLSDRGWGLLINTNESLRFLYAIKTKNAYTRTDAPEDKIMLHIDKKKTVVSSHHVPWRCARRLGAKGSGSST